MQKGNALLYWLKVVSLGLILGLGLQFAQAWTAPSVAPPGGNVSGPVTLGNGAQYKLGRLGVNSNVAPINAFEVGGDALIGGNAYVNGNVGIGTAAPTAYLHVQKPYDPGTPIFIATNSSNDNGFRVGGLGLTSLGNHAASDGSPAAWLNVKAESSVGKPLILGTNDGADRFRVGGAGKVEAFGTSADFCLDRGSGATCLSTVGGGGGSGTVTSLSAGNGIALSPNPIVGAGTISWNHTATQNLNMSNFDINAAKNVNATAFYYTSDRRFKEDIETLDAGTLGKVLQLNGVSFRWRQDGRQDIGVIAQDVEEVFPELVKTDPTTGFKSVEYGNLVAPLIEAVKEQQMKIDKLEARVQLLEKK